MPQFNSLDFVDFIIRKPRKPPTRPAKKVIWKAEKDFRRLKSAKDKRAALKAFKAKWPDYIPERFKTNGSLKTRKGYEALRGRTPGKCGPMGRLRVINGSLLWWSRITFGEMTPELAAIERKVEAQFTQEDIKKVTTFLEGNVIGPFIAVIERGWFGRNHVHVFHGEGACSLGNPEYIPDEDLPTKAGYIYKNPYWQDKNVAAYLEATDGSRGKGKKAPSRIITRGLGDSRTRLITPEEVEEAMEMSLEKPVSWFC
jgi:hypothetical protein